VYSRYMEMPLAVGEDPEADHVRRKVVCLVDKSLDEDDHRDQRPYFAYPGRLHVRGQMLVLVRRRG
jgi:hypothetical protein